MTNKHTSYDLKQMQSLPLKTKIIMTQQRIRQWYEYWDSMVYVSFSGGKDSTVLKHIVDSMYNDVPAVFVNTGLEYPEIQQFVRTIKAGKYECFNPDVEILRPEMRFDEVIKKYGYPVVSKEVALNIEYAKKGSVWAINNFNGLDRKGNAHTYKKGMYAKWKFLVDSPFCVSSRCCSVMKEKPLDGYVKNTGRKPIIGTLADESQRRRKAWEKLGCNAFDTKKPRSAPLSFWTEQDILHYIKQFDVPYCSVYGEIVPDEGTLLKTTECDRTGCIFCMFGCHLEKEPNRFQRLKETHPRQYEYCIGGGEMVDGKWQPSKEGLGLGKILDYIGVKY